MKTPSRYAVAPVLLLMAGLVPPVPSVSAQAAGAVSTGTAQAGTFDPYPTAATLPEGQVPESEGAIYARILHVEGNVLLRRDGIVRDDATLNDPIVPGDQITTDGGIVEIQFADGTVLRLDDGSALAVMGLADNSNEISNTTLLQLLEGSLIVRADNLDSRLERFQVDSPDASTFLLSDGLYRIDVRDGRRMTVVSARSGALEVMSQGVSTIVRGGERVFVRAGEAPREPQVFNTLVVDDFDSWSAARDEALLVHGTPRNAPVTLPEPVRPYAAELAAHGEWVHAPAYGWVWRPVAVAPGWQPYVYGRWGWSPAGMVWVSYEPWGWAPYHYGRWDYLVGAGWVWIPGYVYGGAHVAWGYSAGYLGWCPLGYWDSPVRISLHLGYYGAPWNYVHSHHIYHHHINTVVIRDTRIIHEIERDYVVVDRSPRIRPDHVNTRPRLAEDLHRRAAERNDLRIDRARGARQAPFHENEQRRLAREDRQNRNGSDRPRAAGPAVRSVGRAGADRNVVLVPSDLGVNLPRTPDRAGAGRTVPNRTRYVPNRTAAPDTSSTRTGEAAPERRRPQTRPTDTSSESVPQRVLPRILPGSRNLPARTGSATREAAPRTGAGSGTTTTRQNGDRRVGPTPPGSPDGPSAGPANPSGRTPERRPAARRPSAKPPQGKPAERGGEKSRRPAKKDKDDEAAQKEQKEKEAESSPDRAQNVSRRPNGDRSRVLASRTQPSTSYSLRRPAAAPRKAVDRPGVVTASPRTVRPTRTPTVPQRGVRTPRPSQRPSVARPAPPSRPAMKAPKGGRRGQAKPATKAPRSKSSSSSRRSRGGRDGN